MSAPCERPSAAVFQIASILLDYPANEVDDDTLSLVRAAVGELPQGQPRRCLEAFLAWWAPLAPRVRQELYVETFDLNAKAALYLTARKRGDKRYRGRELLALRDEYRSHGLETSSAELPDYLPLVLEFAAAVPQGRRVLERERPALDELQSSLATQESPFQEVVAAILAVLDYRPTKGGSESVRDDESSGRRVQRAARTRSAP